METKDKIIKVLKPFIEFANERLNREKAENTDDDTHIVYAFNRKAITIGDLKELKQLESELSRLKDEPSEQSDKLTAEEKKTAKEMLQGYDQFWDDTFGLSIPKDQAIEAMEAYHSQFVGEKVTDEMIEKDITEILYRNASYDDEFSTWTFTDKMLDKAVNEIKALRDGLIGKNII